LVVTFAAAGSLLVIFVLLPLFATFLGTPLSSVWALLSDRQAIGALGLTFYAAAWATVLALFSAVPLAYLLARFDFPGKRWVEGVVNLPIVVPHTAAGIALLLVFGRRTALGAAFGRLGLSFVDTTAGIVVAMLFVSVPFLVNAAREAFELVDPELERMAQTQGASRWEAFWHITLPLALRGVLAGALVMWGRAISEFGAVAILAYHPKIMPVLVFERFEGFGLAAAQPLALLLVAASLGVFVVLQTLLARGR
jgi:molybdate/tungstate transport system permease protein